MIVPLQAREDVMEHSASSNCFETTGILELDKPLQPILILYYGLNKQFIILRQRCQAGQCFVLSLGRRELEGKESEEKVDD
jgi:hypothetical protein